MQRSQRADIERWITIWEKAHEALEQQRRVELKEVDTVKAVAELASAFEHAHVHRPSPADSGLVEQQRYFRLLAR